MTLKKEVLTDENQEKSIGSDSEVRTIFSKGECIGWTKVRLFSSEIELDFISGTCDVPILSSFRKLHISLLPGRNFFY